MGIKKGEWRHWEDVGGCWKDTGRILGALVSPSLPSDILLNVFLAIAVDNLADGDNINSGGDKK